MTNKQTTKQAVKSAKIPKSVILPHKCPTCKNNASTIQEAKEIFGLRNMKGSNGKTVTRCQSYCIACRSKHGQKMDKLKSKNKALAKLDLRTEKARKKLGGAKRG